MISHESTYFALLHDRAVLPRRIRRRLRRLDKRRGKASARPAHSAHRHCIRGGKPAYPERHCGNMAARREWCVSPSARPSFRSADPGFFGWGRARTDAEGRYSFRTVMPGAYATDEGALRRPHVNLMVLAIGLTRRLVTTVFFRGGTAGWARAGERPGVGLYYGSSATSSRVRDPRQNFERRGRASRLSL